MSINRVEASRLLAKCIAYKLCGKEFDARANFVLLAQLLGYGVQA